MRRVASELGLGTMSLYHYVRSKDELLDLMSDGIMGGQLVDDAELQKGWRAGLTAIANATRRNFRPRLDGRRDEPAAFLGPGAQRAAPHRAVAGRGGRPGLDARARWISSPPSTTT